MRTIDSAKRMRLCSAGTGRKAVRKLIVPKKWLIRFYATYTVSASDSAIEQGMFEDKMLGELRHSFEQRIGEMLWRKKIGSDYFHSIRKAHHDN